MTKSDLIMNIKVKNDLPADKAEQAVTVFFDTLTEGLRGGRRVELRGFGTFQVRDYDGYMGRNPRTGEAVPIAPKRLPFFKPGKEAKKALNDGVTP